MSLDSFKVKKMIIKILLEAVIIIIAVVTFVSFLAFWMSIRPPKWPVTKTPDDYGMEYESISFVTGDEINISGWFVPAVLDFDKTIIMLHGYPASKSDIVPLGVFLHNQYNLLLFDFRYMGESGGKYTTAGAKEVSDLLGAIQYLKSNKSEFAEKIGVWGFSLGGAVGLMAMTQTDAIQAVVSDSSYANLNLMIDGLFGRYGFLKTPFVFTTKAWARLILGVNAKEVSPENSVAKSKTPILLIHGQEDTEISAKNSQMIHDKASGPKDLWLVGRAGHGEAYFTEKEEYEKKVKDFFGKFLE